MVETLLNHGAFAPWSIALSFEAMDWCSRENLHRKPLFLPSNIGGFGSNCPIIQFYDSIFGGFQGHIFGHGNVEPLFPSATVVARIRNHLHVLALEVEYPEGS
jgi:hypothetical protein